MTDESEAYGPLSSSKSTVAVYANPFGFSLQVVKSAEDIKISDGGDVASVGSQLLVYTVRVLRMNTAEHPEPRCLEQYFNRQRHRHDPELLQCADERRWRRQLQLRTHAHLRSCPSRLTHPYLSTDFRQFVDYLNITGLDVGILAVIRTANLTTHGRSPSLGTAICIICARYVVVN